MSTTKEQTFCIDWGVFLGYSHGFYRFHKRCGVLDHDDTLSIGLPDMALTGREYLGVRFEGERAVPIVGREVKFSIRQLIRQRIFFGWISCLEYMRSKRAVWVLTETVTPSVDELLKKHQITIYGRRR